MNITEGKIDYYVYHINGKVLRLDKDLVDRYSRFICPVDEECIDYMLHILSHKNDNDDILSYRIALGMAIELRGFEYVEY